jgi:hypothetical protein
MLYTDKLQSCYDLPGNYSSKDNVKILLGKAPSRAHARPVPKRGEQEGVQLCLLTASQPSKERKLKWKSDKIKKN